MFRDKLLITTLVMLTDSFVDDFHAMNVLMTLSDVPAGEARPPKDVPPPPHPASLDKMVRRPSWRNGVWL